MKYTKKQRKKIYLKAASLLINEEQRFCCNALSFVITGDTYMRDAELIQILPEFELHKPKNLFINLWWFYDDRNDTFNSLHNSRIFALLLCAEMCN